MKHKIPHRLFQKFILRKRAAQGGNIFFMLFASIGLIAAFAVGANNLTKGLVSSMSDVTRKTIAEERMTAGARLVFQNPVENDPAAANCDADTFVEPMPPRDPGTAPHPVNGGLVPINIGAATKDPWGTDYGYCAWDPGTDQCSVTVPPRIHGSTDPAQTVVAVISAGKDRKFSTTCNAIIGGAPLPPADCTGLGDSAFNDAATGHCYYKLDTNVTHDDAQAACAANGAYLAVPNSAAEDALIFSHWDALAYWIGLDDNAVEGNWQYSYGEMAGTVFWTGGQAGTTGTQVPGQYSNWFTGEAGGGTGENAAVLNYGNRGDNWTDEPGSWTNSYICEKTGGLGGTGAGGAVTKTSGSDDLIMQFTYNDISGLGGEDLWKTNSTLANTATIDKNIAVTDTSQGSSFAGAVELMNKGLILPDDTQSGLCSTTNAESLRLNTTTSPYSLEICHEGTWMPISVSTDGTGGATGFDPTLANCSAGASGPFVAGTAYTPPTNNTYGLATYAGKLLLGLDVGVQAFSVSGGALTRSSPTDRSDKDMSVVRAGNYIFTTDPGAGIVRAYTTTGTTWTQVGSLSVSQADTITADGTYIYVTRLNDGLDAYTFDGTTFTLKGHYASSDDSQTVYSDGTYLYLAARSQGLVALTFNGSSFTVKGTYSNGNWATAVAGDGTYIYLGMYTDDLYALTFNGTSFTVKGHFGGQPGNTNRIFTDGYTIFFNNSTGGNDEKILYAARFDGTNFNILSSYDMIDNIKAIYSDGKYIYAATNNKVVPLTGFACTATGTGGGGGGGGSVPSGTTNLWKFDETTGTTAADSVGTATGTLVNMTPASDWVAGKMNNALDFDGSNDKVTVASGAGANFTGNMTYAFWINPASITDGNYYAPMYAGVDSASCEQMVSVIHDTANGFNHQVLFGGACGGGTTYNRSSTANAIAENTWQYVVVTLDYSQPTASKVHIYVNGADVSGAAGSGAGSYTGFDDPADELVIGTNPYDGGAGYMKGKLDDLRLFNRALSAAEVSALYTAVSTGGGGGSTTVTAPVLHEKNTTYCTGNTNNGPLSAVSSNSYWFNDTLKDKVETMWSDGQYVYTANGGAGMGAYTLAGDGTLTHIAQSFTSVAHIWGDGTYLYTGGGYSTLRAFTFNGTAFTEIANSGGSGEAAVAGDGTYIYTGGTSGKITAYSFNGTAFTAVANYTTGSPSVDSMWSDGVYLYAALDGQGLGIFKMDGTTLKKVASDNTSGRGVTIQSVGDGKYLYVLGTNGVHVFSWDGSGLVLLATYAASETLSGIATDGVNVFVNPADNTVKALHFDGKELKVVSSAETTDYSLNVWSNGQYVFTGAPTVTFAGFGCGGGGADAEPNPAVVVAANKYKGKLGVGDDGTCLIKPDNSAWCAGADGTTLQLGNGATTVADQTTISRVADNAAFTSISSGYKESCGIHGDGTAWCWGDAASGRLGNGLTTPAQPSPVAVSGGHLWTQLSVGKISVCGIRNDGQLLCWGSDTDGVLGNGTGASGTTAPGLSSDADTWVGISVGSTHACGIKTDGSLWCWGKNDFGQVGVGTSTAAFQSPVEAAQPGPWVSVATGDGSTCAVKLDGTLWCWGLNDKNQAGEYLNSKVPRKMRSNGPWMEVFMGPTSKTPCAIKIDGTGWCWGNNSQGQGANQPNIGNEYAPGIIGDPGPWVALGTGPLHGCGIKLDGSAWCWGKQDNGRRADGLTSLPSGWQYAYPSRVLNYPAVTPFAWNDTATVLTAQGAASNIALGANSAISYDGTSVSGVPNGLRFDTAGQTVLRQSGASGWTPPSGLLGWWKFDETSGTTTADSSGNGITGTLKNGATFTTLGKQNGALSLSGSSAYVDMGSPAALDNKIRTICAWINQDNNGTYVIADKGNNSNTGPQMYVGSPYGVAGMFDNNELRALSNPIAASTWFHQCVTVSSAHEVKLYQNGAYLINQPGGAFSDDSSYNFAVGIIAADTSYPFKGLIDDVMIFDRDLSAAEIATLYTSLSAGTSSSIGSELKIETQSTTASSQITWAPATAANTRSMGIDYLTKSFEIGVNSTAAWLNTVTPQMEITAAGNVGVGTVGAANSKLELIGGGLRIGNDTGICVPLRAGTIRYVGGTTPYQYCDGTVWTAF